MIGHGIILSQLSKYFKIWFMNKVLHIIHKENQWRIRNKMLKKCTKNTNFTIIENKTNNFNSFPFILFLSKNC